MHPATACTGSRGIRPSAEFIYVTTATLTHEHPELSDEVAENRSLLVLCSAFRASKRGHPNLTVKKIANSVLSRCEGEHDDYTLLVENQPKALPKLSQQALFENEGIGE